MDNFGILAHFQALIVDKFSILAHLNSHSSAQLKFAPFTFRYNNILSQLKGQYHEIFVFNCYYRGLD